jgi:two-component sensor histidine kinase
MPSLLWDVNRLRAAIDAAEVGLWSWNVDTDEVTLDHRGYDLWGHPRGDHITFEDLSLNIHPADVDGVRNAFMATRQTLGTFEIDFRLRLEDEIRWVSARGQGDDKGMDFRVMFGVFLDVTRRKQAEEANELLSEEMSHRVKNLLVIASGLAVLSSKSAETPADLVKDLSNRLIGLGRAHDLVRPTVASETKTALIGDLFTVLLSPYDDGTSGARRVRVSLPRLGIGERAISALAMVVHELATNSLKYGALAGSDGSIDISAVTHGDEKDLVILWAERGGPQVESPPARSGFGSKLIAQCVSNDLGGAISFDWSLEGLIVTLRINEACLLR